MAVEFGPQGIRSNIIAPGPIAGTEGMSRLATKDTIGLVGKSAPVQRMGDLDDIANAGVFLFSPAASYITGIELVSDGGSVRFLYCSFTFADCSASGIRRDLASTCRIRRAFWMAPTFAR